MLIILILLHSGCKFKPITDSNVHDSTYRYLTISVAHPEVGLAITWIA